MKVAAGKQFTVQLSRLTRVIGVTDEYVFMFPENNFFESQNSFFLFQIIKNIPCTRMRKTASYASSILYLVVVFQI